MEDQKLIFESNSKHMLAAQTFYFFRARQRAIGLEHNTQFVKGLAMYAYWIHRQQAENKLGQAAMLKGVIETIRSQVKILTAGIEEKPLEEQRAILLQAMHLREQAERGAVRLEALDVV